MFESDFDAGFDSGFNVVLVMFVIMFCLVIGLTIFFVVRGMRQWNKNNNSPRLTVFARVVTKRTQIGHYHSNNTTSPSMNDSYYTHYYVTFEVQSGDRMELGVNGDDYGMLAEGDVGNLSFQGTRFLGFERQ